MQYVRTDDNVKIAVYDQNPGGCCETILMIHGWPLAAAMYEYQKEALFKAGYRVITLDLRGFGRSDAPACGYTYDRMAADIYTVVRCLNLRGFTLVGFSMGGAIVLRYMARYNGYSVKKLALLAAAAPTLTQRPGYPYGVPRSAIDQWIEQASTDRPKLAADFGQMLFACPQSPELISWLGDLSLEASGVATVATARALRDEDGRADLRKVRVPTGIFHGKKDRIVPYELALVQQEGIPCATLFPFENSGHGIFYDELEDFNCCLLNFLQGRC